MTELKELHVLLRISVSGFRAFHACYMFPPNITVGAQDQAIHVWPLITHPMTSTVLAALEKAKGTLSSLLLGFLPDDR